jgi:predicted site-specific integrase-resolvase
MTRCALYLRVSSKEQKTDNHLQPLEQFCKSRGFEIVEVYAENESVWQSGHQKEWTRLMHDAEFTHTHVGNTHAFTSSFVLHSALQLSFL